MGETGNAYKSLVGKLLENKRLEDRVAHERVWWRDLITGFELIRGQTEIKTHFQIRT
jgi:hypothetical protein